MSEQLGETVRAIVGDPSRTTAQAGASRDVSVTPFEETAIGRCWVEMERRQMMILVQFYFADYKECARVCDEELDRSGELLGRVREAALYERGERPKGGLTREQVERYGPGGSFDSEQAEAPDA